MNIIHIGHIMAMHYVASWVMYGFDGPVEWDTHHLAYYLHHSKPRENIPIIMLLKYMLHIYIYIIMFDTVIGNGAYGIYPKSW